MQAADSTSRERASAASIERPAGGLVSGLDREARGGDADGEAVGRPGGGPLRRFSGAARESSVRRTMYSLVPEKNVHLHYPRETERR